MCWKAGQFLRFGGGYCYDSRQDIAILDASVVRFAGWRIIDGASCVRFRVSRRTYYALPCHFSTAVDAS